MNAFEPESPMREPTLAERIETDLIRIDDLDGTQILLARPADVDLRRDHIACRGWLGDPTDFQPDEGEVAAGDIDVQMTVREWSWPARTVAAERMRLYTVVDVLRALLYDAATWENTDSYSTWAHELGFGPGHMREYEAVQAQTDQLRNFLGDLYLEYLWRTAT